MKSRSSIIKENFLSSSDVKIKMAESSLDSIEEAADYMIEAIRVGGKILLCGNGGSAADCQHIAAELVGRFQRERKGFSAVALTTDTSIITSLGNDYGYRYVFSRQVEALGRRGDVLIGISTSGKSENVITAMERAKELGMRTVALTGINTDDLVSVSDVIISVPSASTQRIQEAHITVAHIICELIEDALS